MRRMSEDRDANKRAGLIDLSLLGRAPYTMSAYLHCNMALASNCTVTNALPI